MRREPLTDMEKAVLRIESLEGYQRETNGRLRQLEEAWADFVPSVTRRISNEIILPGLIRGLADAMQQPNLLRALPDGLNIDALLENEKRRERG